MSSVPYKQGAADRYYGRKYQPRMSEEEYKRGWNEEQDRKDWGDGQFAPQQADRN
jgi:hypothetical protein